MVVIFYVLVYFIKKRRITNPNIINMPYDKYSGWSIGFPLTRVSGMLNLIVNETPWDDEMVVKAAFDAAEVLRREYSLMVFVEINSHLTAPIQTTEDPTVVIGDKEIRVDPLKSYGELVEEIIQAVIENAALGDSGRSELVLVGTQQHPSVAA